MRADVPRFADFERVVLFSGAGMSAESGVPTYRGAGGIWKQYDYRRYACQDAFDRDPEAVWEFHNFRRGLVGACAPNDGHRIVAQAQKALPCVDVVTQNIDGLHQLAGATHVVELHGSLWRLRCDACGATTHTRDAPLIDVHCPCGAFWRPAITWFGDPLDDAVFSEAARLIAGCDLFVAVGTSAVVYPAAALPQLAKRGGATMVEVNPEQTDASDLYSVHLRGTATEMLAKMAG